MRKLKPVIFLIALLIISGMVTQAAFADTPASGATVIVLVDRAAVTESDGSRDLIASVVGLIGTLQEKDEFIFATVDAPNDILGPVTSGVTELQAVQDEFYS